MNKTSLTKIQNNGGKNKIVEKKKNKKKYKVRNWKEYNQALVNRGKVCFWITEEILKQWENQEKTGKRGRPRIFSDSAIETVLTLQQVFHIPLRLCEGFMGSILLKMGELVQSPDYSTLSIRGKKLSVSIRVRSIRQESLHIVVDSTGAKVFGEGEWKVRQHGWSKRRTWKKLHIGVDETTGDIVMGEVTRNEKADCQVLETLLNQIPQEQPIDQVSLDGAYDKRICYEALKRRGVVNIAIPPQHNAKISQHGNLKKEPYIRDENLRRVRAIGRKQWKIESNYHRRSLAETGVFRLKTIFGDRVSARTFENQKTQLLIRCKALNWMTTLGMPDSYGLA